MNMSNSFMNISKLCRNNFTSLDGHLFIVNCLVLFFNYCDHKIVFIMADISWASATVIAFLINFKLIVRWKGYNLNINVSYDNLKDAVITDTKVNKRVIIIVS